LLCCVLCAVPGSNFEESSSHHKESVFFKTMLNNSNVSVFVTIAVSIGLVSFFVKQKMRTFRTIEKVFAGNVHGAITRVISPGEATGELLKPFVFLDYVVGKVPKDFGFPYHSHSGIATLTYQLQSDVSYIDTEEHEGILEMTGIEWMVAGGGAWHKAKFPDGGDILGFQLWVPLPPGVEDGPSHSEYVKPGAVPLVGNVKVLLGEFQDVKSAVTPFSPMNLFDIVVKPNESFVLPICADHDVAWAFVYEGEAQDLPSKKLVKFSSSGNAVLVKNSKSDSQCRVLFGSAVKHPFPLVLGHASVHTNQFSLQKAREKMDEIRERLAREGKLLK